jgi:hypothetical protein
VDRTRPGGLVLGESKAEFVGSGAEQTVDSNLCRGGYVEAARRENTQ